MTNFSNVAYRKHLQTLIGHGEEARPRGLATREILGLQYKVDMGYPIVTLPPRAISFRFLAAEAAWILSGSNRLAEILPYMSNYAQFSDDGHTLTGAYGPPLADQLPWVVRQLRADGETRQAVATIWRPRPGPSRDIPCTVALQFILRENRLHAVATMRSSDAWLGVVYDQFTFTMAAALVACQLDPVPSLGNLILTFGSAHLYERDLEKARQTSAFNGHVASHDLPLGARSFKGKPDDLVGTLWELATALPGPKVWNDPDAAAHAQASVTSIAGVLR